MKLFEFVNDNNHVVIDDSEHRIKLSRVLSISDITLIYHVTECGNVSKRHVTDFYIYETPLEEGELFIAIKDRETGDSAIIRSLIIKDGENKRLRLQIGTPSTSTSLENIKIFIYGQKGPQSKGYGIQLFSANGEEVYNSEQSLLNVKGEYEKELAKRNDRIEYGDFLITDNQERAVVINNIPCGLISPPGQGFGDTYICMYGIQWKNGGIYMFPIPMDFFTVFPGYGKWASNCLPSSVNAHMIIVEI